MQKITLVLIFLISLANAYTQNLESQIDQLILKEFSNPKEPGGAFLVFKSGEVLYKKAFGLANLELGVKMTPEQVFQIGSMTKQFTAVAILMLEEQGKLNVEDPISNYIPDYPNGENIQISHLLSHTSGIKDFTKMKAIADIANTVISPREMLDFFKNEPVDFSPGEAFKYNNSGYVVLGYIIEQVSNQTYEEFIQEHIFDKLHMTNSTYASDRQIIPNRAYGYHQKSYGFVNKTSISYSIPYASGSLMSTLEDMLKWQNALNQNQVLQPENLEKAFTKQHLNDGEQIEYGYGWHLKEWGDTQVREHGGSIFGFKSMGVYIPETDIYVVGFSNCDCHSPTQLVRDIAELVNERHSN